MDTTDFDPLWLGLGLSVALVASAFIAAGIRPGKKEPRRPLTFNQRLSFSALALVGAAYNLGSYLWNDFCFLGKHHAFACGTDGAVAMFGMLLGCAALLVVAWTAP